MVAWAPLVLGAAALANDIFGKKKKAKKRSTMDKNQKRLWDEYHQGIRGEGPLKDLYSFDANKARQNYEQNMAQPQYQKFQEEVVPGITGSFRSQGLGKSTYAGQALARTGRNLQQDINAGMNDYLYKQEQSINDRRANAVNQSFNTNTFDYQQPQESAWDSFLSGAGGAVGKYAVDSFMPRGGYKQSYGTASASAGRGY